MKLLTHASVCLQVFEMKVTPFSNRVVVWHESWKQKTLTLKTPISMQMRSSSIMTDGKLIFKKKIIDILRSVSRLGCFDSFRLRLLGCKNNIADHSSFHRLSIHSLHCIGTCRSLVCCCRFARNLRYLQRTHQCLNRKVLLLVHLKSLRRNMKI